MSKQDIIGFSGAGLIVWALASAFYAAFGESLLETAFWFYALNAFLATGAASLVFQWVAKTHGAPRSEHLLPALAFALPGLTAAMLLVTFGRSLLDDAPAASLGRYALFVLASYGAVIAHGIETRFEQKSRQAA